MQSSGESEYVLLQKLSTCPEFNSYYAKHNYRKKCREFRMLNLIRIRLLTGLMCCLVSPLMAQTLLQDGESVRVEIDTGNIVTNDYAIDLPEDASFAKFTLQADDLDRNVVILVRVGSPFEVADGNISDQTPGDYISIGPGIPAELYIQEIARPDPRGQRLYLALGGIDSEATAATLTAVIGYEPPPPLDIEVVYSGPTRWSSCSRLPWNDEAAYIPEGGNMASTRGEARRIAMEYAVSLVEARLTSRVPFKLDACWYTGGTTPFTYNQGFFTGFRGSADPLTAYPSATITRLVGTPFCSWFGEADCELPEIGMTFGLPRTPSGDTYYYGLTPSELPDGEIDFVESAVRNLLSILAFQTLATESGELPLTSDGEPIIDVLQKQVMLRRGDAFASLDNPDLTDDERAAAYTSGELFWSGDLANLSEANQDIDNVDNAARIGIFSPEEFGGNSLLTVDRQPCDILVPSNLGCRLAAARSVELAASMMEDMGWHSVPDSNPVTGFYFDPERNGHGLEFRLAGQDGAGVDVYVLTFYSYNQDGTPEWYQAIGRMRNGAFIGQRLPSENSLERYQYMTGQFPPQRADDSRTGRVVMSFNDPDRSPACEGRSGDAVLKWQIEEENREWCLQSLVSPESISDTDFGGLWFTGLDDQGWGMSIESIALDDRDLLFMILYVYDANGEPVWYLAQIDDFEPGVRTTADLIQRDGFARTDMDATFSDRIAGQISFTLTTPSSTPGQGNVIHELSVTLQDSPGGDWLREEVDIQRLSQPR